MIILDLGWALKTMNGIIRKKRGDFKHTETQKRDVKNGIRDWSDAPEREGMLRIDGNCQRLGESQEIEFSFKLGRRNQLAGTFIFDCWPPEL